MSSAAPALRQATDPDGWRLVGLMDLVSVRNGQVSPLQAPYSSMVLVAPDHVESGTGRLLAKESAWSQGAISGKYIIEPGDIVYSKIRPYLQKAVASDFTGLCSADMYPLRPKPGVDSKFVLNLVLSQPFTDFATSVSARSGIPKINRLELAEFTTLAPPPLEQKAIGTVLSDADSLIASLRRLIAKKQAIKQGMMQDLLGGRVRLPDFTTAWVTCPISDLADQYRGSTNPKTQPNVVFQHFSLPAFDAGQIPAFDRGSSIDSNKYRVPSGAVLVSKLNPRIPRVWAPNEVLENAVSSTEFIVCLPKGNTDRSFLKWLLKSETVASRMSLLATGTTGSHQRMHPRQFAQLDVTVPSEPDEQAAIAAVLDDAERAVELLKLELAKAFSIKRGMMQELLTGRTRLPSNEVTA